MAALSSSIRLTSAFLNSSALSSPKLFSSFKLTSPKPRISLTIRANHATLPVLSFDGVKVGETTLNLKSAPEDTARAVVHRGITTDLQNKRRGTASTLTRAEVRGGGRKPYPQKKTGRARRGSTRTPLKPGGGVVFGPKPRDWSIKINRDGDTLTGDNASPKADREPTVLTSNLFLDRVGEVVVTLNSNGLRWKLLDSIPNDESCCLGTKLASDHETSITFSDLYAVEFEGRGSIHDSDLANAGGFFSARSFEMYIFKVHAVKRYKSQPSLWIPSVYTFGHKSLLSCQLWVNEVNGYINMETDRPKSLLVFVNPRSGKGNGCETWDAVEPIFSLAKVEFKVTVTEKAAHAFGVMQSISDKNLSSYDGVVVVGGDGFFNEVLNGILLSRHKAPYPPTPPDFVHSTSNDDDNNNLAQDSHRTFAQLVDSDEFPLLFSSTSNNMSPLPNSINEDSQFSLPNKHFRFGIIPAGSTDTIAICTTGARDAMTSALHIVLGKRVSLDIIQIVRWKTTPTSKGEISVRYAASFAGYGFYGDVITGSEKYRWMGPVRYDYAGTIVFLQHRSYEAEVAYLDVKPEENNERCCCHANCSVCKTVALSEHPSESKWVKSKGRFLSVGAAVISCRNEKAPDGLVADAHLSDGFLHLILIKDCPRALYLWHLIQLTRKGGSPLNFKFIEHHKTRAFTFTCGEKQSVWNVDGELFQAHQLSAQVFPGLISLFATGPPV